MKRITGKIVMVFLAAAMMMISGGCEIIDQYMNHDLYTEEIYKESFDPGKLVSHYIDVGQGDSIIIELPNGKTMLIDAGVNDAGDKVADYIYDLGCEKIDYLVATHPHADHIGGMRKILNRFDVGEIYMPKASADSYTYEKLLKLIKKQGKKITTASAGMNIIDSDEFKLKVDILAPCSKSYEKLNDYSVVIAIEFNERRFLYMGDAEQLSEKEIMDKGENVAADVIKIGHHGSYNASSAEFVKAVGAKYGVISVGTGNDYGHPHKAAMNRWKKAGTKLLRTDTRGTIVIATDGTDIEVETEKRNNN